MGMAQGYGSRGEFRTPPGRTSALALARRNHSASLTTASARVRCASLRAQK
ncbi:hypothetical protein [Lysobacter gummosus]|uniref:hypothetical protein n=1 Tax=Lysobacter gummosus TaxID=262324 RepID=UPI003629730D